MSTSITPNNTNIRVVTINTPGPRGPQGPAGPTGSSIGDTAVYIYKDVISTDVTITSGSGLSISDALRIENGVDINVNDSTNWIIVPPNFFINNITGTVGSSTPSSDNIWFDGVSYASSSKNIQITGSLSVTGSHNVVGDGANIVRVQNTSGQTLFRVQDVVNDTFLDVQNTSGQTLFSVGSTSVFISQSIIVTGSTTINGDFTLKDELAANNRFRINESGSRFYSGSIQLPSTTTANLGTSTASITLDSNYYQFIRQVNNNQQSYIELPSSLDGTHDGLSFKIIYHQFSGPGNAPRSITISASDGKGIVDYNVPNGDTRLIELTYVNGFKQVQVGAGTGWVSVINSGSV